MSEATRPTPRDLFDRDDALLVTWLAVRAVLLLAGVGVIGLAIRVLIWTSGLGG